MSRIALFFAFIVLVASQIAAAEGVPDAKVREVMIRESIASYSGSCPCPYNQARNGSACGKRSAWSRPGGYAPLCYPSDISDKMVEQFRRQHGIPK